MSRLNRYLIAGILMVAPLAITIYIGYQIVIRLDAQMHRLLPEPYATVPGLGFVVLIVALIFIGFITTGVIGTLINRSIDLALRLVPVPMVRSVYGTLRQMLEQIFSSSSSAFREVVMVEYPRKGVFALGFLSGESYEACQVVHGMRLFNVFVPTTPNPTSGFLLLIPENEIIRTKLSVEEGIKLVVSSGIVHPEPASEPELDRNAREALAGEERPFSSRGDGVMGQGSKRVNGRLTVVPPSPGRQAAMPTAETPVADSPAALKPESAKRGARGKPYQSPPSPALRNQKPSGELKTARTDKQKNAPKKTAKKSARLASEGAKQSNETLRS